MPYVHHRPRHLGWTADVMTSGAFANERWPTLPTGSAGREGHIAVPSGSHDRSALEAVTSPLSHVFGEPGGDLDAGRADDLVCGDGDAGLRVIHRCCLRSRNTGERRAGPHQRVKSGTILVVTTGRASRLAEVQDHAGHLP